MHLAQPADPPEAPTPPAPPAAPAWVTGENWVRPRPLFTGHGTYDGWSAFSPGGLAPPPDARPDLFFADGDAPVTQHRAAELFGLYHVGRRDTKYQRHTGWYLWDGLRWRPDDGAATVLARSSPVRHRYDRHRRRRGRPTLRRGRAVHSRGRANAERRPGVPRRRRLLRHRPRPARHPRRWRYRPADRRPAAPRQGPPAHPHGGHLPRRRIRPRPRRRRPPVGLRGGSDSSPRPPATTPT